MTTYQRGFENGVVMKDVPILQMHPGRVFWVGNNSTKLVGELAASNNNKGEFLTPFSTLDYAIGQCAANREDIVYVRPTYAQTIADATSILMDVAGIQIIGLGEGDNRPTISYSAVGSSIPISAANISFRGFRLLATINAVVAGLTISGAKALIDIDTSDTSASVEFISAIVTTAAADDLKIKARHRGFAAGSTMTRYIDLVGCQNAQIDVDFFGTASVGVINMRTTACDNIMVTGLFYNASQLLLKNVVNSTTSTWSVRGYDALAAQEFAGGTNTTPYFLVNGDLLGGYDPFLGYRVTKTASLATGGGTAPLYTITGRCLITHLSGEVTTQVATTTTLKLTDTTNTVDFCAATTITTDVVGTIYILNGVSTQILNGTGNPPVVGSAGSVTAAGFANPRIAGDVQGPITLSHILDAAGTGAVAWVLYYKPLTSAAIIVAA